MKARWSLPAICVGLLAALIALPGAQADNDDDDGDSSFGRRIAGVYFLEYESADAPPTFDPGFAILDYDADGTYSNAASGDALSNQGTERGVWERTGRRTVAATSLVIDVDDETGDFSGFLKLRGTMTFTRDFQESEGFFEVDVFGVDQDPLTDEPFFTVTGRNTARRLSVE